MLIIIGIFKPALAQSLETKTIYSNVERKSYNVVKVNLENLVKLVSMSKSQFDNELESLGYWKMSGDKQSIGNFIDIGQYEFKKVGSSQVIASFFAVPSTRGVTITEELKNVIKSAFVRSNGDIDFYELSYRNINYKIAIATQEQFIAISK